MPPRAVKAIAGCSALAMLAWAWWATRTQPIEPAVSTPAVRWTFEAREAGALISTPLLAEGRVFLSVIRDTPQPSHGAVVCLDGVTGKPVWEFDDEGRMLHMYSSCALADGRLYVGEGMHANPRCKLYCLSAESGRKLWDFTAAGHIESTPVVVDDGVVFGAGDDGLYCLAAESGLEQWHYQAERHIDATVAVQDNRLFGTSGTSRRFPQSAVFCLDASSGNRLWETSTDLPAWGSPALAGSSLLVGLGNGRLAKSAESPARPAGAVLCLDANDGQVRWRFDLPDAVLARVQIEEDRVYFGSRDGFAHCLNLERGELLWKRDLGSPIVTTPSHLDAQMLFVAGAGRASSLAIEDGRVLWEFDAAAHTGMNSRMWSSPVSMRAGARNWQVLLGAELEGALAHKAALFCLIAPSREESP